MGVETITGRIRRIRFHKVSKGSRSGIPFLIAELTDGRTIKGEMLSPSYAENYRFFGETRPQKGWADAFEFDHFEEVVEESVSGVAQFLTRKIKGVGPKRIKALVEAFGVDTLRTLQANPEMAKQVDLITDEDVAAIKKYFDENRRVDPQAVARLLDMFSGHQFPKKLAENLVLDFGSDAPGLIRDNPYLLLAYPRMGWQTVDPFAIAQGYDREGLERHKAAIVEALEVHSKDGHTYATKDEADLIAFKLLNGRPSLPAWVAAVKEGAVVSFGVDRWLPGFADIGNDPEDFAAGIEKVIANPSHCDDHLFSLPRLAHAEEQIASRLASLTASAKPLPFEPDVDGLNDDQQAAIRMFVDSGVCLLLGAPGTGKTYTLGRFVRSCIEASYTSIRIVAPTGKAAKRAEEMVASAVGGSGHGIPCTTVHRALEPTPGDLPVGVPADSAKIGRGRDFLTFGRNESRPVDADLVIVDETSMLDVKIAESLLSAIKPGCRMIFIGDTNQLPSVGAGSVLRDLKESGHVPFVELDRIVRSDGGGYVVKACHAVKAGRFPVAASEDEFNPSENPLANWLHLERGTPEEIADTIVAQVESIKRNGRLDPLWDVQVISAERNKPRIGCRSLNERLSAILNPKPGPSLDEASFTPEFRDGDKVVRVKNGVVDLIEPYDDSSHDRPNWWWDGMPFILSEVEVVNGDMGQVVETMEDDKHAYVIVRFRNPDRLCRLPRNDSHLQAAYAMTVHKAQGSGFKVVIVPVHLLFQWNPRAGIGLFSRELFYTAISRAEQILITVGQWSAVETVVGRKTVDFRRTMLAGRLEEEFSKMAAGYSEVSR